MPVSIIMPCYNEEGAIEETVRVYYKLVVDAIGGSEFIVIDDASTDNTPLILKRLQSEYPRLKVIRQPVNKGHGQALMLGYRSASKEFVFNIDSDNCFKAEEFLRIYNLKDEADLVSGYRVERKDPLARIMIGRFLKYLNLFLFGVYIKDANCPFKLIRRSVLNGLLDRVPLKAAIPSVLVSILYVLNKDNRMIEVPVEHYPRKFNKYQGVDLNLARLCLSGLKDILTLRLNLMKQG